MQGHLGKEGKCKLKRVRIGEGFGQIDKHPPRAYIFWNEQSNYYLVYAMFLSNRDEDSGTIPTNLE